MSKSSRTSTSDFQKQCTTYIYKTVRACTCCWMAWCLVFVWFFFLRLSDVLCQFKSNSQAFIKRSMMLCCQCLCMRVIDWHDLCFSVLPVALWLVVSTWKNTFVASSTQEGEHSWQVSVTMVRRANFTQASLLFL